MSTGGSHRPSSPSHLSSTGVAVGWSSGGWMKSPGMTPCGATRVTIALTTPENVPSPLRPHWPDGQSTGSATARVNAIVSPSSTVECTSVAVGGVSTAKLISPKLSEVLKPSKTRKLIAPLMAPPYGRPCESFAGT